jgi:hypothetical protein
MQVDLASGKLTELDPEHSQLFYWFHSSSNPKKCHGRHVNLPVGN